MAESAVLVLYNNTDELFELLEGDDKRTSALKEYLQWIVDTLKKLPSFAGFRHLIVARPASENDEGAEHPKVGYEIGVPVYNAAGNFEGVDQLGHTLDIAALLTGAATLPQELEDKTSFDANDVLLFSDPELAKTVQSCMRQLGCESKWDRMQKSGTQTLSDALTNITAEGVPDSQVLLDPYDVLRALVAHVAVSAGLAPPRTNPLQQIVRLGRNVLSQPERALGSLNKRVGGVQRLLWQAEGLLLSNSTRLLRFARKSVRPILIAVVVARTYQTLEASRSPLIKMAKLPVNEQADYYYRTLLGDDWEQQMEADFVKAVQDVNDGLITDDINHEKRKISAAALRRLEIEDWDKERMKNHYMYSFSGIRWYQNMEEALHNPMFISSRGWTDPVQNWVGENRTYPNDLPVSKYAEGNVADRVKLCLAEQELGTSLTPEQRQRVLQRLKPTPAEDLADSPLFEGIIVRKDGGVTINTPANKSSE